MKRLKNDSGSILVFVTLIAVILLVMVGMGLDTGWLTFSRSMGQRAVDMAALAGAAGLAKGDADGVEKNIEALNNTNDYVKASGNKIDGKVGGNNVMLVKYDPTDGSITRVTDIATANGVRVALENSNPYGTSPTSAINTSHFLMPMLNFLGISTPASTNIDVSAVAVYSTIPGIPLALGGCEVKDGQQLFKQAPGGGEDPNNSGWTTYTAKETNTPDIIDRIKAIVSCQGGGEASIGTPICLGNGQNSPVVREFESLADPSGNKCYFTPVVDPILQFNQCDQPIRHWAKVCITAVCAPPDSNKNPLCTDTGQYIVANVKACDLKDSDRVGQCFKHSLVREKEVGM